MKAIFKNLIIGTFFIFAVASPVVAVAAPQTAVAAACSDDRFLGIPPWYRGLVETNNATNPPSCDLVEPKHVGGIGNYVWRIALNVVEMAIIAVAYLAVFFILYGGFLFMTGGANPSQIERGRKTILNAVIGLVICMGAIALTNLAFTIIT